MARVQDFNTVIPTDSDNLLVVQATGQGLATVGSTLGAKLDKENPTGTGSLSLNRKANTTVGTNSATFGNNCEATANYSLAEGDSNKATGAGSHAEGYLTIASGNMAHAEGYGTHSVRRSQHVFGEYNDEDTGGAGTTGRGTYIEIVGKGTGDASRSNARTLDWNGNEVLAGGLKINGNKDVAIQSDFTPTAGALTNQHANFSGGGYSLTRTGKVVVFSFFRGITGSITGNVELATLPSGFIPYANTRLYATSTYNGNTMAGSVEVTTAGKVVASYGSGNLTSALTITGAYICS